MKGSELEEKARLKQFPRRRRYQDAKFSTLLHSPNAQSITSAACPGVDVPLITTKNYEKLHNNNRIFAEKVLSNDAEDSIFSKNVIEKQDTAFTNHSVQSFENSAQIFLETKNVQECVDRKNIFSSRSCKNDQKLNQKNGVLKNTLFEKYLYLDGKNVNSCSTFFVEEDMERKTDCTMFDRKTTEESPRTPRVRRRHTTTGTGGLTLQDIENWISENKKGVQASKDDSEVLIAKTNTVEIKQAETVNNMDRQKKKKLCLKNEKKSKSPSHFQIERLDSSSSCQLQSAHTKFKKSSFQTVEINFENKREVSTEDNITSSTEQRILKNGIDNCLKCFVTPRPYKKSKNPDLSVMSRSWSNRYSHEATIKEDEELSSSWANGYEEKQTDDKQRIFSFYSSYISDDDDDFVLPSSQPPALPHGRAKYDTFLDLSQLDLEDNDDNIFLFSCDTQSGSVSDSESTLSSSWKSKSAEKKSEKIAQKRTFENKKKEIEEKLDARASLTKINEGTTEEEFCSRMQNTKPLNGLIEPSMYDAKLESARTEEIACFREDHIDKSISRVNSESAIEPSSIKQIQEQFPRENRKNEVMKALDFSSDNKLSSSCSDEDSITVDIKKTTDDDLSSNISSISVNFINSNITSAATTISIATESIREVDSNNSNNFQKKDDGETNTSFSIPDSSNSKSNLFSKIDKSLDLDRNTFLKNGSKSADIQPVDVELKLLSKENREKTSIATKGMKRLFQITVSTIKTKKAVLNIKDLLDFIVEKGIKLNDPRLSNILEKIEDEAEKSDTRLTVDTLTRICEPCYKFIQSLLLSQLIIPGFDLFKLRMSRIFDTIQQLLNNQVDSQLKPDPYSSYNALIRKLRSDKVTISLSVCTVDGQRCSFGDTETPHPLNICSTVFNYCLACRQNGTEGVSYFLGDRIKPPHKNEFMLEPDEKVWNPFTKSGAIMTSSLLFRELAIQSKLTALHRFYRSLIGNESLCCDNLSYNYKRFYDHEEIGLAYFLSATQRLPKGTSADLSDFLDFHFQASSSAMTSDACAVAAATLANGGVCPITGDRVIDSVIAKQTVSIMRTCNACEVPDVQSSNSISAWNDEGSLLIVIPRVMGITCFTQCQSFALAQTIVKTLVQDLKDFNFEIYRSLKETREAKVSNNLKIH